MGDGGARTLIVADVGGMNKGQDDFYNFWNGDTGKGMSGAPVSEGGNDFLSGIQDIALKSVETVTIAFWAGEIWDCTDDVDSIIELPSVSKKGPDEIESECTQYNLGHEWMNCYSNVEYVEPPEGEGPQQPEMSCDRESVCGAVAPEMQPACQDCFTNNVGNDAGVYACLTALCTGGSPDPETCSQGAEICNPANL